jgi:hypothetical protein
MEPISRGELFNRLCRKFARYEFHVSAELMWTARTRWGRVTNISREGMFIEVAEPPRVGTRFTVRLALNTPLQFTGIVRRIVTDRGIGAVIFVDHKDRKRFEALLFAIGEGADPARTHAKAPSPEPPRVMAAAAGS